MPDTFNWGVMGNATIARVCVIPAIQKSRNGTVSALATRSPKKASDIAAKNHIGKIYGNYHDLLKDPDIEAIYIPLPNHLHHEWSLKALAAGKHVLCEKPLACNAQQAQEMAHVAESTGCLLMEAFMFRYHPRSKTILRHVRDGTIGTPHLVRAAFCFRMSPMDFTDPHNARLRPDMGGGALLDVGCYCVSAARWIYGEEPLQVQCQACYNPGGVDIHVTGMMKFDQDRLATLEASFIAGLQQTYTVVGENGVLEMPHDAFIPWEKDTLYILRENDVETGTPTVVSGADEYQLMVEHFADAALGLVSPEYTPADSVGNMRVLDALSAAARNGDAVSI